MTNTTRSGTPQGAPANLAELCTLSPDALEDRLAMVRREIGPHASATQRLENGIAWDFDATPDMRAKLENLARLESECCGDLEFEIWENPSGTRLRFEISGADPNSGFFDGLSLANPYGTDEKESNEESRRWLRFAKRGGLAVVASFVVCCVLPLAIVSVAGITVAAPLMKLDNPVTIGAGAVLFGALFWLYEKHRSRTAVATPEGSASETGCGC